MRKSEISRHTATKQIQGSKKVWYGFFEHGAKLRFLSAAKQSNPFTFFLSLSKHFKTKKGEKKTAFIGAWRPIAWTFLAHLWFFFSRIFCTHPLFTSRRRNQCRPSEEKRTSAFWNKLCRLFDLESHQHLVDLQFNGFWRSIRYFV